eukprot:TRINITY_DN14733_c0_g1_i1.p1 TRINITY_DN14733_c0_g1~~TRINITY_DN14733_c0_g1_i1.p1  ORF type:complete len:479 (-),score=98.78 TRINITY_DN14733_c0_g1_i1:2-1438(-)
MYLRLSKLPANASFGQRCYSNMAGYIRKPLIVRQSSQEFTRHQWIYQHQAVDFHHFTAGELVNVYSSDEKFLGIAYVNPHSKIFGRFIELAPVCFPEGYFAMDLDFFLSRLKACVQRRKNAKVNVGYVPDENLPAIPPNGRLVNSEGDFLPGLIVDVFGGDKFVVQVKTAGMEKHINHLYRALNQMFNPSVIVERNDISVREQEGLKIGRQIVSSRVEANLKEAKDLTTAVEVTESHGPGHTLKFKVDLFGGQKTGYYWDQTFNRSLLRNLVKGKSVLDLYCYVGSWGLFAAHYGAKSVVSVDSSAPALKHAQESAELNGLASKVQYVKGDVESVVAGYLRKGTQFDVVVLDPPGLTHAKGFSAGMKKFQTLHETSFEVLAPGGILISCSCSYPVKPADHLALIQAAAARTSTSFTYSMVGKGGLPYDHPVDIFTPESDYLTCFIIQKGFNDDLMLAKQAREAQKRDAQKKRDRGVKE